MSGANITNGVIVAFDVFSKSDIRILNEGITNTFGTKAESKNSAFFGSSPATGNSVWNVKIETFLPIAKKVCKEKGLELSTDLTAPFVDSFQIIGYDSPSLQFYVIIAKIQLNKEALNSSKNMRVDLWQVSLLARSFIESLKGYNTLMSTFSPSSPFVTQLWVCMDKNIVLEMQKNALTLVENKAISKPTIEISKRLRELEPVNLSAPVGDIHSHILMAANVTFVIGHSSQVALGGLMQPFVEYLTYDEALLNQNLFEEMPIPPAEIVIPGGFAVHEYEHLIGLLSLWIHLRHLAFEREQIDVRVSELREQITSKKTEDNIEQELFSLNELGTQISSLQQVNGRLARYWKGTITQLSEGRGHYAEEIPIENIDSFSGLNFKKGYIAVLADEILSILKYNLSCLRKQEMEIASLRTHISDIVNLKLAKSNELLQKRMKTLAEISIIVSVGSLIIGIINWILQSA